MLFGGIPLCEPSMSVISVDDGALTRMSLVVNKNRALHFKCWAWAHQIPDGCFELLAARKPRTVAKVKFRR